MRTTGIFQNILYAVQGAIVGVGAILPGVSGGVLCVAFGIYEPMMAVLTHPVKSIGKYYKMFIPFLLGWALGFVVLAKGVEAFFQCAPTIALMLFFGLICGTLPELFETSEKSGPEQSWSPFVISLALAYLFFQILDSGIGASIQPSFWSFGLCGLLWGLSMIVPGMSSSSILICLGLFEPLTAGIGSLDGGVLLPFVVGICVTVVLFARLVAMLFDRHYAVMSRVILGFVIASALKALPVSFGSPATLLASLVCFAGGFVVARAMDRAKEKENT